jgi:hypothetical protein
MSGDGHQRIKYIISGWVLGDTIFLILFDRKQKKGAKCPLF